MVQGFVSLSPLDAKPTFCRPVVGLAAAGATSKFTGNNKDDISSNNLSNRESSYQITIEYCTGCKWGLRGFWTAQELLSTFRDDRSLGAVTVIPSATPGRFAVSAQQISANNAFNDKTVLWDRHEADGFPEMKQLKQLVRDQINPERYLGHSDSTERKGENKPVESKENTVLDFSENPPEVVDTTVSPANIQGVPTPHVTITYCTGCNWLLRAAYVAQELVSTFSDEIHAISLLPSRPPAKGGAFVVMVDEEIVWDRKEQGRFPETKELKQLVRNVLNPSRDLGHIDHNPDSPSSDSPTSPFEDMDDEEAAEARRFFGVM